MEGGEEGQDVIGAAQSLSGSGECPGSWVSPRGLGMFLGGWVGGKEGQELVGAAQSMAQFLWAGHTGEPW